MEDYHVSMQATFVRKDMAREREKRREKTFAPILFLRFYQQYMSCPRCRYHLVLEIAISIFPLKQKCLER